jgi:hypothetical protein
MFSRIMDSAVEAHFGKDINGRLVFIPFTSKGKRYFVDSKSDEEKIRAFVKMYRSALAVISFIVNPVIWGVGFFLDDYAGMTPRSHRLAVAVGVPLFFWLVLIGLMIMLWVLYKQAIPAFTRSLSEVGPDVQIQLAAISPKRRRIALVCVGALLLLIGLVLFALQRGPRRPCPTQPHVCQQGEVDSSLQPHPQS